jgi:hypothetical protein
VVHVTAALLIGAPIVLAFVWFWWACDHAPERDPEAEFQEVADRIREDVEVAWLEQLFWDTPTHDDGIHAL